MKRTVIGASCSHGQRVDASVDEWYKILHACHKADTLNVASLTCDICIHPVTEA